MCLIRGSFIECVAQVFELVYLFYFPSFSVSLILFTLPLSLIEHHHFRLLNIHFQLFLSSSSFISFLFHTPPPPPPLVFSLTFHPYLPHNYIVNSRGLSGQPCLTPFVVSNHSPRRK
jgi:hypothetical protein